MRMTSGFRPVGDRWLDVHGHVYVPGDLEAGSLDRARALMGGRRPPFVSRRRIAPADEAFARTERP